MTRVCITIATMCISMTVVVSILTMMHATACLDSDIGPPVDTRQVYTVFPVRLLFFAKSNEEFRDWAASRDHAELYEKHHSHWIVIHSNASVDLRPVFRDTPSTVEHVFCNLPKNSDRKRVGSSLCILDWLAVHPLARADELTLYLEHDVYVRDVPGFVEQIRQVASVHTNATYAHRLTDTQTACETISGGNPKKWLCRLVKNVNGVSMWNFARLREHVRQDIKPGVEPEAPLDALHLLIENGFASTMRPMWDKALAKICSEDWDNRTMSHRVKCECNSCDIGQLAVYLYHSNCTAYHAVSDNRHRRGFDGLLEAFYVREYYELPKSENSSNMNKIHNS